MNPKVSICIPAYNQTDYLRKCLESITIQKYNDFEIIITDDSTNDSVKNLIDEFDLKGKLRYFKNSICLGSPENWNEAVRHASGNYIKMLHHDDWFKDEDSLSGFVDMLDNNPQADFAFSACEAMDESMEVMFLHQPNDSQIKSLENDANVLFIGNFIGAPSSTIYRRNISLEYDINLKWLVDVDFYIRVLNLNKNFVYKKEPLVRVSANGNHQITKEVEKDRFLQAKENLYLYKKIASVSNTWFRFLSTFRLIKASGFIALVEEFYNHSIPFEVRVAIKIRKFMVNIKKIIPFFIKRFFKKIYFYILYINDFLKFKKMSKGISRFKLTWKDRYPQLFDKTSDTSFDRHYTYHPAWAARIIAKTKPKKHIDISSILHFSTLVSAFVPVEFYDYRPAKIKLDNLLSKRADLTSLPFKKNSVESLSCMHTIEHVGLGRYGDPIDPDGDIKAMNELMRVLAPGGSLLFVTPIGKPKIEFNAHRIYSYDMVLDCFKGLKLEEFSLIMENGEDGIIKNASKEIADKERYGCGCFWFKK